MRLHVVRGNQHDVSEENRRILQATVSVGVYCVQRAVLAVLFEKLETTIAERHI